MLNISSAVSSFTLVPLQLDHMPPSTPPCSHSSLPWVNKDPFQSSSYCDPAEQKQSVLFLLVTHCGVTQSFMLVWSAGLVRGVILFLISVMGEKKKGIAETEIRIPTHFQSLTLQLSYWLTFSYFLLTLPVVQLFSLFLTNISVSQVCISTIL